MSKDDGPHSFAELENAANRFGCKTFLLHWIDKEKAFLDCPALLHVRRGLAARSPDHFVACFGRVDKGVCIGDFPRAPFILPYKDLYRIWDGDILYIDRRDGQILNSFLYKYNFINVVRRLSLVVVGLLAFAVTASWILKRWSRSPKEEISSVPGLKSSPGERVLSSGWIDTKDENSSV